MVTITRHILTHVCRHQNDRSLRSAIVDAAWALGPLARWWLQRQYLDMAASVLPDSRELFLNDPVPDDLPGSCSILFALQVPESAGSFLRRAFLLPLQWKMDWGAPDDPHLPPSVKQLADAVRESLHGQPAVVDHKWSLRLGDIDGIGSGVDLSLLDADLLPAGSGWASLAAALLLRAEGGKPDATVLATGCWSPIDGLTDVGSLQEKLSEAPNCGIRRFFLPERQHAEARQVAPDGLRLDYLPYGIRQDQPPNPRIAIAPLLSALDVPPRDGSFGEKQDYYMRQWRLDRSAASRFYQDHLLADVLLRCRERTMQHIKHPDAIHTLITTASFSPELILLAVGTFQPSRCVVLVSREDDRIVRNMQRAMELLEANGPDAPCEIQQVPLPDEENILAGGLRAPLGPILDNSASGSVVWDLTPGQRYITVEMIRSARPSDLLAYLVHKHMERDLRIPGEERYHVWSAVMEQNHG